MNKKTMDTIEMRLVFHGVGYNFDVLSSSSQRAETSSGMLS